MLIWAPSIIVVDGIELTRSNTSPALLAAGAEVCSEAGVGAGVEGLASAARGFVGTADGVGVAAFGSSCLVMVDASKAVVTATTSGSSAAPGVDYCSGALALETAASAGFDVGIGSSF